LVAVEAAVRQDLLRLQVAAVLVAFFTAHLFLCLRELQLLLLVVALMALLLPPVADLETLAKLVLTLVMAEGLV
jgi:hypothetical protein